MKILKTKFNYLILIGRIFFTSFLALYNAYLELNENGFSVMVLFAFIFLLILIYLIYHSADLIINQSYNIFIGKTAISKISIYFNKCPMNYKSIRRLGKSIIQIQLVVFLLFSISCKNENYNDDKRINKEDVNYPYITNFLFFKKGMTYDETKAQLKLHNISYDENPEDSKGILFKIPSNKDFRLLGEDYKIKVIKCFSLKVLNNTIPSAYLYFANDKLIRLYYYSDDTVINSPKSMKDLKLLREIFFGLKDKYGNADEDYVEKNGKIDTTVVASVPMKRVPDSDNGSSFFSCEDVYNWKSKRNGINIKLLYYESKLLHNNSDYRNVSNNEATQTEIDIKFDPIINDAIHSRYMSLIIKESEKEIRNKEKNRKELLKKL